MSGFLVVLPQISFAGNLGVEVDQTAIVFDVNAGESQQFVINVKNISGKEQEIILDAKDYVLGENNDLVLIDDKDEQTGLSNWLSVDEEYIKLTDGEKREIVFTVNTPNDAVIGSHRGAAIFRIEDDSDNTVQVNGQVGVHVLVNVKGDTHASGRVNKFDIPLLSFGTVEYAAEFENTGNIHYVPYGEIVVRNIFTKKENLYEYEKHFVFPGKIFEFIIVEDVPSLFGLYKATTVFVDGEGATRMKIDFTMGYFFPLVAIIVIVCILVLLKIINSRDKKHIVKKQNSKKRNNARSNQSVKFVNVESTKIVDAKKDQRVSAEEDNEKVSINIEK